MIENAMTIDVEDWFHVLDTAAAPQKARWDQLPPRIESNLSRLLDLFAAHKVKTTLFWLGWAAERLPHLVKHCHALGHEIASHGYGHVLAYQVGETAFRDDASQAKLILEDLIGAPVLGYRVPGFSFNERTPWAYTALAEIGYRYSSSIFPAHRGHGGLVGADPRPHTIQTPAGPIVELPISTVGAGRLRLCLFGGGYLRLFPTFMILGAAKLLNQQHQRVMFYVHPREIDPDQPRISALPKARYFKYYVNLKSTEPKLTALCQNLHFTPLRNWL